MAGCFAGRRGSPVLRRRPSRATLSAFRWRGDVESRPRDRRQRADRPADRRRRRGGMGLLPALRRRPGVLRAARHRRAGRAARRVRSRSRRLRADRAVLPAPYRDPGHPPARRRRQRRRDHRLRAPFPAARQGLSPDDARAARSTACGKSPGGDSPAPGVALRQRHPCPHGGQQPPPLRRRRRHAAPDHRCLPHGHRRGARVRSRPGTDADARRRRIGAGSDRRRSAGASSRKRQRTGGTGCAGWRFRSNGRTP